MRRLTIVLLVVLLMAIPLAAMAGPGPQIPIMASCGQEVFNAVLGGYGVYMSFAGAMTTMPWGGLLMMTLLTGAYLGSTVYGTQSQCYY